MFYHQNRPGIRPNRSAKGTIIALLLAAVCLLAPAGTCVFGADGAPISGGNEIDDLKRLLLEQQRQISEQQKQIGDLRRLVEEQGKLIGARPASGAPQAARAQSIGEVASAAPVIPPVPPSPRPVLPQAQKKAEGPEVSPLQFRIGSAYITPIGFMDLTTVWRSTAPGSGIGTNFGSIPFGNTTQGRMTEMRLSAQNSRIGSRVDAMVKGAKVTAYWESDFLGFVPTNAAVSSNADTFRLRVYWVDVRKGKFEFLGGQSWSMITPGRKGISPLPGDLFYTQNIDVNYQAGATWSRDPQFRFVYHPNETVAMGVSLEAAEQYIGGSAGAGVVTLPTAVTSAYANQLNSGGTTLSVPNVHPDIVAKIAFDPKLANGHALHFEVGGTERTFRVYNPLNTTHFFSNGLGGQVNLNYELLKGFRVVTNNYWSNGGGRWIFGLAPDLIVRGDGSLSAVHSGSTVSGIEFTRKNTLLYGYYSGVYIGRNTAVDPTTGKLVGYGFAGSSSGQNRTIQEGTVGFTQTFWKDATYGALSLMGQYSYLVRNPWAVASGQPKNAKENILYLNLRYALPGSAPVIK